MPVMVTIIPSQLLPVIFSPRIDPADQGGHGRRQGHQEHGNTGTDDNERLKQAEIAEGKANKPGEDKDQPGTTGCIYRKKISTVDPSEDAEEDKPDDQP